MTLAQSGRRVGKRISEDLAAYGALEILKWLAGFLLTFFLSLFAGKSLIQSITQLARFNKTVLGIFISGGLLVYLIVLQRYTRLRPRYRRIDADFRILKHEIIYRYNDLTHMVYTKRKKLKALKSGLSEYHDKYRWTGSGTEDVSSAVRGETVQLTEKRGVWQCYVIRFGETLDKGGEVETECNWQLEDIKQTAVHFFSATIEEPTDLLEMTLSLDPSLGVTTVICEESSHIGAQKPFKTHRLAPDRSGKFTWVEPKPKLLHHYEMKWSF